MIFSFRSLTYPPLPSPPPIRLKYLNASGCFYLELKETLDKLCQLSNLEELCLGICGNTVNALTNHERHINNRNYRNTVIKALAFLNPNLHSLDNVLLSLPSPFLSLFPLPLYPNLYSLDNVLLSLSLPSSLSFPSSPLPPQS